MTRSSRSGLSLALLLMGVAVRSAAAQGVTIGLADVASLAVPVRESIRLPLIVSIPAAAPAKNLAAFQATMSWSPKLLQFDSLRAGGASGLALTTNAAKATDGELVFNAYAVQGLQTSATVGYAYFSPLRPGAAGITLEVLVAGDEMGRSILSDVRGRTLQLCLHGPRSTPSCSPPARSGPTQ